MSVPPSDPCYFEALQRWSVASARLREEITRLSGDPHASLAELRRLHEELQAAQQALQSAAVPGGTPGSGQSLR